MKALSAAGCVGLAAWCSLGTLGLENGSVESRIGLLPPSWLLPLLIMASLALILTTRLSSSQVDALFGAGVVIVPWLPIPLPPAALLWTGPFAAVVWILVLVGVIGAGGSPARSRWLTDARRAPLAAAAIALTLYGASAWWLAPIFPDGDSPHYLILAQSLIRDRDLQIENNHRRGDYLDYSLHAEQPHYLQRGVNGAIYSIHAPGLPAVIAPAFFLLGYPGAVAFLALIAAVGAALVWYLGYRTTGSIGAAWFGWASSAVTTPFFFQATQVFPDGLAATCVLLGVLPLIAARFIHPAGSTPNVEGRRGIVGESLIDARAGRLWLVAGLSLALLPWLQTRLTLIALAAALCVCARMRRFKEFVWFASMPAVGAIAWFGYFFVLYGTFNPAAPYGTYTQTSFANLVRGGPGLIFDQQFGLIPNAPVYGFILAAVVVGATRLRRWHCELLIVMVPYAIGVGMFQIWWGGTSAPARLVAPVALMLGVAAAGIWYDAQANATRAIGLAAIAVSVLIAAVLALPDRGALLLNFRDGVALWLEWGNGLVDVPRAFPSLFRDTLGQAWLKAAIWGACGAAGWLVLRAIGPKADQPNGPHSPVLAWPAIWCLTGIATIALAVAWRTDRASPLTPETSKLTLLGGASPFRSLAYDFGAHRFERSPVVLARLRVGTDQLRRSVPPGLLLSLSDVPAGTYQVRTGSSGTSEGKLVLRVGDTSLPLWTTTLSANAPGMVGPPLRLPVPVRSLTVDGDEAARRELRAVELEPLNLDRLRNSRLLPSAHAHRAAPYGSTHVYFIDDNAYPEPSGFWVAGGRKAQILVVPSGAPFQLFLRNAPVENTVTIDVGGDRQQIQLNPGEETAITLPHTNRAVDTPVRISTSSGFRPSQMDPRSEDLRHLGCWVEIR